MNMFTEAIHGRAIAFTAIPLPFSFCGGAPQVYLQIEATNEALPVYVAGCTDCGAEAPAGASEIEGAFRWNLDISIKCVNGTPRRIAGDSR